MSNGNRMMRKIFQMPIEKSFDSEVTQLIIAEEAESRTWNRWTLMIIFYGINAALLLNFVIN